jgi:GWxTD domain-containing protein
LTDSSTAQSRRKGHLVGGLFLFWALAAGACGGAPSPEAGPTPRPVPDVARPLHVFRQLGLIAGPDPFPAVGRLAQLAGAADSTLVLFALSMPTSALRFQREADGFAADYLVTLRFERDGRLAARIDRRETVRVGDFTETGRTDESVLFQTGVHLAPGTYVVTVRVRDGVSARGLEVRDTLEILSLGPGPGQRRVAAPLPVLRATPGPGPRPADLVMNARGVAAYGGRALVYVEAYADSVTVLEVRGEGVEPVWRTTVPLPAGAAVVDLPVDSLPLGRFSLRAVAGGEASGPSPFLVTVSDDWIVSNFEEVLELLRYIAPAAEVDSLAAAEAGRRRQLWDGFWAARDPVPATPANEFRDEFFQRIRVAILEYSEPGRPGWRTDRGEVYILLGPPTEYREMRVGGERGLAGEINGHEWVYDRVPGGRSLRLIFLDRNGLGSYRLTAQSASAFRDVAHRIRESAGSG